MVTNIHAGKKTVTSGYHPDPAGLQEDITAIDDDYVAINQFLLRRTGLFQNLRSPFWIDDIEYFKQFPHRRVSLEATNFDHVKDAQLHFHLDHRQNMVVRLINLVGDWAKFNEREARIVEFERSHGTFKAQVLMHHHALNVDGTVHHSDDRVHHDNKRSVDSVLVDEDIRAQARGLTDQGYG